MKPRDFYRAVFPEGSFEREGHPEDRRQNDKSKKNEQSRKEKG